MTFNIQCLSNHNRYAGREGDELLNKIVHYEEDFDYLDPNDPNGDEYTLSFSPSTIADMLRSLPRGVKWNPRSESFEGW